MVPESGATLKQAAADAVREVMTQAAAASAGEMKDTVSLGSSPEADAKRKHALEMARKAVKAKKAKLEVALAL